MSVNIVVSGDGGGAVVTVTGGIGPAAIISGTATTVIGVNPVYAGANVTVTTAAGSITIIGRDVPVQSVQGRTGNVVLTLIDLTAASSSHTHSTTEVSQFTTAARAAAPVQSVAGRTGNVTLSLNDITAAASVHTHSTTEVSGLTATIQQFGKVVSVNGKTGTVTLTVQDLTAAASVHTHTTTDISSFTTSARDAAPVQSVQGRTGSVVLSLADVTGAASVHTHSTADISGLTETIQQYGKVVSVNGKTGTVTLTVQDITAAASVHTHAFSSANISDFTSAVQSASPVQSVNGRTGAVVVDSLPGQTGNSSRILSTDGTNASWTTRYSVVDPVIVAGGGMNISRDTSAGQITIAFAGGTSGVSLTNLAPLANGQASAGSSSEAARADHVHPAGSVVSQGGASRALVYLLR